MMIISSKQWESLWKRLRRTLDLKQYTDFKLSWNTAKQSVNRKKSLLQSEAEGEHVRNNTNFEVSLN